MGAGAARTPGSGVVSGGLDIRRGGMVVVDTQSLRDAAGFASTVAERADAVRADLHRAARLLADAGGDAHTAATGWVAEGVADEARDLAEDVRLLSRSLHEAANLYEATELRARWLVADSAERSRLEREMNTLLRDSELARAARAGVPTMLLALGLREAQWRVDASSRLRDEAATLTSPLSMFSGALTGYVLVGGLQVAVGLVGRGTITDPAADPGPSAPVDVRATSRGEASAPTGLAEALNRIPGGGDDRVRVERYDFAGRGSEWVVYITGTQALAGDEPFDMTSNLQLYAGQASASVAVAQRALREAGHRPGEPVHTVGHSQGGMIAANLALANADVRTLITAGSPVTPRLSDQVLRVELRHLDDPIAALAGQGPAVGTGSADSFVAQRVATPGALGPPGADLGAVLMPAHVLPSYVETAQLIDGNADPRVDGVRRVWEHLGAATTVTASTYSARRTS